MGSIPFTCETSVSASHSVVIAISIGFLASQVSGPWRGDGITWHHRGESYDLGCNIDGSSVDHRQPTAQCGVQLWRACGSEVFGLDESTERGGYPAVILRGDHSV